MTLPHQEKAGSPVTKARKLYREGDLNAGIMNGVQSGVGKTKVTVHKRKEDWG
jgi:hypothetical protein